MAKQKRYWLELDRSQFETIELALWDYEAEELATLLQAAVGDRKDGKLRVEVDEAQILLMVEALHETAREGGSAAHREHIDGVSRAVNKVARYGE